MDKIILAILKYKIIKQDIPLLKTKRGLGHIDQYSS